MKYLAILAIACIPLAALIGWSFYDPLPEAGSSSDNPTGKIVQDAEQALAQAKAELEREGPVVRWFPEGRLFDATSAALPQDRAGPFEEFAKQMSTQVGPAVEMVGTLENVPFGPREWPPKSLTEDWPPKVQEARGQIEQWQKQIEQYLGRLEPYRTRRVPQSGQLIALLEDRIQQAKQTVQLLDLLEQAARCFGQDDYRGCLAELEKIRKSPALPAVANRQALDAAVQRLDRRATYGRDRTQQGLRRLPDVPSLPEDITEPQVRQLKAKVGKDRTLIEEFLKSHPNSPDELDKQSHQELVDRQSELTKLHDELALREEFFAGAKRLSAATTLPALSKEARQLATRIQEHTNLGQKTADALRVEGRRAIDRWLTQTAFPHKQPPPRLAEPGIREAYASHKRYLGRFYQPEESRLWRIWYWDGQNSRVNKPDGDVQISEVELKPKEPIRPPLYVQWANGYNKAVDSLVVGGTKSQWLDFFRQNQQREKELKEYQDRWGVEEEPDKSCKWSFLPNREVLLPGKAELSAEDLSSISEQLEEVCRLFRGP